jgi:hypothetical protein
LNASELGRLAGQLAAGQKCLGQLEGAENGFTEAQRPKLWHPECNIQDIDQIDRIYTGYLG